MEVAGQDADFTMAPPSDQEVETKRRHGLGLGWHLPLVVLLLVISLAQILPAGSRAPRVDDRWSPSQLQTRYELPAEDQAAIFEDALDALAGPASCSAGDQSTQQLDAA